MSGECATRLVNLIEAHQLSIVASELLKAHVGAPVAPVFQHREFGFRGSVTRDDFDKLKLVYTELLEAGLVKSSGSGRLVPIEDSSGGASNTYVPNYQLEIAVRTVLGI